MSVVIPTMNEAANIGWVLDRLPGCIDEVVIVDGLSTDGTVETVRALRPDANIVLTQRPGKGAALQAGFAAARGDVIVMIDADGSMDPAEIPRFVDRLEGCDLVKGSRFLPGAGSSDLTRWRRLGNGSLLTLVNRLYRSRFTDLCYGFCAFHAAQLDALAIDAVGFEVETMIVLHALRTGMRIAEVPSFESERHAGASKLHPCRDGMRVLRTVVRERRALRRATRRGTGAGIDGRRARSEPASSSHGPSR